MEHISFKEIDELIDIEDVEQAYAELDTSDLFAIHEEHLMTSFISAAVGGIFKDAMEKMIILRGIFRVHGHYPQDKSIYYRSLKDRFEQRDVEDNIPLEDMNYYKLQRDINMLMLVWREACQEIKEFGTYLNAQDMFGILTKMTDDERELVIQEPINKKKMLELRAKVVKDKEYYLKTIEDTVKQVHVLKFTLEDVKAYSIYELNYLKEYEDARVEQNALTYKEKESNLETFIDNTNTKIENENLVHELMTTYVEESRTDYLEEIEHWTKYYDEELERRDQELITLRGNIEKMQEDLEYNKRLYEDKQKQIEEWMEYARIKKEKEEQEQLELWASITLQIWWRYMMKKRKLGPYKKKGKGKDKGKKKKK